MRCTAFTRALVMAGAATVAVLATSAAASPVAAAADAVACHDASLERQRTEIDADIGIPQFDPALGTLLEVSVGEEAVHLDTDAAFENTAQTAVLFAETMTYQLAFTSPGGLASPPAITGTIPRITPQTLAAFDGTLDYQGPSAVSEPLTTRDESAAPVGATDAPTLAAFTGSGTMPFHLATAIGETFTGGGGNVRFQIETFAAATVRVCYRYAPPPPPPPPPTTPPTVTPPTSPPQVAAETVRRVEAAPPRPTLPNTGSSTLPLGAAGGIAVALGGALAWRARPARPRLVVE